MAKYGLIKGTRLNYSVKQFKKELEFLKQHENISETTYIRLIEFINDIDEKNKKCMNASLKIKGFSILNMPKIIGSYFVEMVKKDDDNHQKDKRKKIAESKNDLKNNLTEMFTKDIQSNFENFKSVKKAFKEEFKSQKVISELKECLEALGCKFKMKQENYNGEFEIDFYNSFHEVQLLGDLPEKLKEIFKNHQFVKLSDEKSDELTKFVFYSEKYNKRNLKSYLRQLKKYIPDAAKEENFKDDIRNQRSSINEVKKTEKRIKTRKYATEYLKRNYKFIPIPILKMYFEWKENLFLLIGYTDENMKENQKTISAKKEKKKREKEDILEYLKRECQECEFFLGRKGEAQEQSIIPFFKRLLEFYDIDEETARMFEKTNENELNDEKLKHKLNIYNKFKTNFILPQVESLYNNSVKNSLNFTEKDKVKEYIQFIFRGYNSGNIWGRNTDMPQKLEYYIKKAHDNFNLKEGVKSEKLKKLFIEHKIELPLYFQFIDDKLNWSENLEIKRDEFAVNDDRNMMCILAEMLKDAVGEYPTGVDEIIDGKRDKSFAQPVNPNSAPTSANTAPPQKGQNSMWIR